MGGGSDEGEEGELGGGETVLGLILFDGEGVVELVAMFGESLRVWLGLGFVVGRVHVGRVCFII